MTARSGVAAFAVAVAAGLVAPTATAHGPCRCLDPPIAEPGQSVRLVSETLRGGEVVTRGWPAYKIIFNPRPRDLGIAPDDLASAYRPDAPTVTVLSRPSDRPTRKARFRVPNTAPGVYMVLIFDGGEGGAHNSWEYLHVVGTEDEREAGGSARAPGDKPGTPVANSPPAAGGRDGNHRLQLTAPAVVAIAGALLAAAGAGWWLRGRRSP